MNLGMILGSILLSNLYFFRTSSEVLDEAPAAARTSTSKVPGVTKSHLFDDFFVSFFEASFWIDF